MKKETQIALAVAVVLLVVIAIAAIFMLTGGGGEQTQPTQPPVAQPPPMQPPTMGPSQPSVPNLMPPSQQSTPQQVAIRPRKDPFALLPEEVEAMQADAFTRAPFALVASPPPPPKVELPEPYEPQPKRRVAGIILGQTVSAILEQEGELPQIVYPGDMVGEFRVAAITPEGVILRRSKGNPREVRVPYEPPGVAMGGGAAAPGGGAGAPGAPGIPGAPGPGIGTPSGGRGGPRGGGAPGI
ncbi:hypothetical protein HRbin15_00355 [bacterium HR15]|nr:hypothetical protein HRbin15_00355 [bacterium HR15]